MNRVLNGIESRKNDKHLKTWVKLRIYHRKNETFFVRKSFFWQRESIMTTMLLFWNSQLFLQSFLFLWSDSWSVWISSQKITKIFSFFVCLSCLCGIELSQSTLKFVVTQLKHHWNQRPRSLKILIEIISLLNFSFIVIAKILIQSLTDEVHSRMNYIF